MVYMQEEMIESLKKDIQEGKIWGLRLIKTPVEVIQDNSYAMMFNVVREITGFDDDKFFLKTKRNVPAYYEYKNYDYQKPGGHVSSERYFDCEAYYQAFSYYDGDILRSILNIPAAVDEKDAIQIAEYEVLKSY